ncbi:MAG: sulfite oxidase [Mycobacterium sp.]|uniref:sulfite oxidase n=1 Tax=Mycobacterium sp. TaxID=1785 RepID=UPI002627B827|nr:sulfite oxidase [Mycobacterium sp.]MDI3314998.1 sulfite oxidase [Mycobacterium sp.]
MTAEPTNPPLDWEQTYHQAAGAGLLVHTSHPLNAETPLPALVEANLTPVHHFYVRNHFLIPALDAARWRLTVTGHVLRRRTYSLQQLYALRAHTRVVTLECAGNNRSALAPPVSGPQWGLGAAGTAAWTGVPLIDILDQVGPKVGGREVVFRGADCGQVDGSAQNVFFERSLSLDDIAESGALLAYAMNGAPLSPRHGYPLRLVVPGWYGMASVKWLTEIDVIDHSFTGHFQTRQYRYEWLRGGQIVSEPVQRQQVRAIIAQPVDEQRFARGNVTITGLAWSGVAPIAQVWVSVGERPWQQARLLGRPASDRWRRWELPIRVDQPGATTVRARAVDHAGRTQPQRPEWNRQGYGVNAVQTITIHVY